MTRSEIIAKIKKCLSLSKSSNEHEAATALRQARNLMEAHGISDIDVQAAGASETRAKSGATSSPAIWENKLAGDISSVFGCRIIFISGPGEWCYIGCGVAPDLSKYAFEVLLRQAKRARTEYIKTNLKRCKPATKTRRADLFCIGWVNAVAGKINAYAGTDQQTDAIDAYIGKFYPSLTELAVRNRNADRQRLRDHELDDIHAGRRSGNGAALNRGVGGFDSPLALE